MSYDVHFEIDTGDAPTTVGDDSLNHTYNCSAMFRKALGGDGINDLHGQIAGEVIHRLECAVQDIRAPKYADEFREMNPPNGWGSHDTAARFLELILENARRHPTATIRVS